MRRNLPVLDKEIKVGEDQMIVSRTNLKGVIDYANKAFIDISGFTEAEVIGAPHNIVRHPDMPPEAFADLWDTLKAGRPWTGMVKNRCKDGSYYWVLARATPVYEDGKVVAYLSVRTRPTQAQIDRAAEIYRSIQEGRAGRVRVEQGSVVSGWPWAVAARWLRDLPLAARYALHAVLPALLILAAWSMRLLGGSAHAVDVILGWAGMAAVLQLLMAPLFVRGVLRPLRAMVELTRNISSGDYRSHVDVQRSDELGMLQQSLSSMQTRLGFEIAEAARVADENHRVRSALDASSANVMLADPDGVIRYLNPAVTRMFHDVQDQLRQALPGFDAGRLEGVNFDDFHRNPAHQRNLLGSLSATHRTQIKVAGLTFALTANPIFNERRERLGTVVEWQDRTLELAVEHETSGIVAAAAAGDFTQRLALEGKTGFFAQLAKDINRLLEINSCGLAEIALVLSAMAEGNLSRKAQGNFQGTFERLKDDCNLTVTRLVEIVGRIRGGAEAIKQGAGEIATGNDDLARRTEQQAAALEETAAALEELTSTVRQNAEHAGNARQMVQNTSEIAMEGGSVVEQVVAKMAGITESSRRISDIIAVIDGIAFQTNILALNAAVEAARAGAEGRGFAVVATEVRSLAGRSADAAKQIKALITESVANVGEGARLVDAAGRSMTQIVEAIRNVNVIVGSIATASQEQAVGIEQINLAITQMDDVGQQNAALVEEASAAAKSMAEQTELLVRAVSVFDLG